ncbi:hypothetical protein FGO68_gene3315 [Halteria grandinella]|uniref:Uncharacterized protein n=1 Tax=Halteria grandinella TaxID=5974 RepID=A0A8J8NCZ6_HALGN|nr:hypothetical protein FGO68_gene3315 [Halteria grandinella]
MMQKGRNQNSVTVRATHERHHSTLGTLQKVGNITTHTTSMRLLSLSVSGEQAHRDIPKSEHSALGSLFVTASPTSPFWNLKWSTVLHSHSQLTTQVLSSPVEKPPRVRNQLSEQPEPLPQRWPTPEAQNGCTCGLEPPTSTEQSVRNRRLAFWTPQLRLRTSRDVHLTQLSSLRSLRGEYNFITSSPRVHCSWMTTAAEIGLKTVSGACLPRTMQSSPFTSLSPTRTCKFISEDFSDRQIYRKRTKAPREAAEGPSTHTYPPLRAPGQKRVRAHTSRRHARFPTERVVIISLSQVAADTGQRFKYLQSCRDRYFHTTL